MAAPASTANTDASASASASDAKAAAPAPAPAPAPAATAAPTAAAAAAGAGAATSPATATTLLSPGATPSHARKPSGPGPAFALPPATKQGLLSLYSGVTCGSLVLVPGKSAPVVIDSHASVTQASALLASKHISSAPVYDAKSDTYLRLLDYVDINHFILQFLLEGHRQNLLTDRNTVLEDMLNKTTVTIIPSGFHTTGQLTKQNPFFSVKANDSLLTAIKLFTQSSGSSSSGSATGAGTSSGGSSSSKVRVYRAVVLDPTTGRFASVLSQSDVVRWLAKHLQDEHIKSVASKNLTELQLVQSEVTSINGSAKVFDAFVLLARRHLSSVAVVDDDGLYLGAIQHSHIRTLLSSRLYAQLQSKTCAELLAEQLAANPEDDPMFACVEADATLHSCIKRCAGHHFQRLWVLAKDANKPVGVVALSDILRVLSAGH